MELKFRNLYANEIECRISRTNKSGVELLLYKDARCDQNILDETVGPMRWQRHHCRENANCVVSIYDTDLQQWVEKEDTGKDTSFGEYVEKALASDSFKRACFNWGIGRELYTSPYLFVPKDKLKAFIPPENDSSKAKCYDKFVIREIVYENDSKGNATKTIKSVTIDISYRGETHHTIIFTGRAMMCSIQNFHQNTHPELNEIKEDEIIRLGNCRGKRYGEVKNTETFKLFLKWVRTANATYDDPVQKDQLRRFKIMAQAGGGNE